MDRTEKPALSALFGRLTSVRDRQSRFFVRINSHGVAAHTGRDAFFSIFFLLPAAKKAAQAHAYGFSMD